MTHVQRGENLHVSIKELMIPAERVAHVQVNNSLEHALLVLTKSGYSAIPVLDSKYRLQGLISSPIILDSILGLERIEFELLEKKRVEEVMNKNISRLTINSSIHKCIELLIDNPFLCIVGDESHFEGIVTRRSVLLHFNSYLTGK